METIIIKGINYNEKLQNLKNEYSKIRNELINKNIKFNCKLYFNSPVELINRREKLNSDIHTVKSLFFLKNGICNCMDDGTECEKSCYTPLSKKTSGFYFDISNLEKVEFVELANDYSKEWQKIADSMRKYDINLQMAENIEKHLKGEAEHIEGMQNYWKRTDKPRIASFADCYKKGGMTIDQMKVQYDANKKLKEQGKMDWIAVHTEIRGLKRDRSITMEWTEYMKSFYYHAASEYSGYGNGDYYIMFSPTMAFYAETD
jgi:hypothetical protein